jgi:YD repeat-containing protein
MKNIRKLGYSVSAAVLVLFVSGLIYPGILKAETVAYNYDANGRLLKADYGGGKGFTFSYDKAGNILTVTILGNITAKGDINDDGKVDLTDAILSLQVLSGMLPNSINTAADVNGDGKIGMSEAIYVMQKIAGLR